MSRRLFSLLLALCAALAAAEHSDVLELDGDNFHSSIDDKDLILVEFYAPWYVCDTPEAVHGAKLMRFLDEFVTACNVPQHSPGSHS